VRFLCWPATGLVESPLPVKHKHPEVAPRVLETLLWLRAMTQAVY
jgi:hypothetical protein